jgi:hypothetical protein
MDNLTLQFQRQRFDFLRNAYRGTGYGPERSRLRLIQKFQDGKSNYTFKVRDIGMTNPHVLAKHLSADDAFVANSAFVGIYVENDTKPGTGVFLPYPVLDTAAGTTLPAGYSGLSSIEAESLYNGLMSLKSGSNITFSAFPLDKFRVVPETQPSSAATVLPEWSKEKVSLPLVENVKFAGTVDQYVEVSFPLPSNGIIKPAKTGFSAYLVVDFDGFLVRSGVSTESLQSVFETI